MLAADHPDPEEVELSITIPAVLRQLELELRTALPSGGGAREGLLRGARLSGHELLRSGLTLAEVVHEYRSVRQAIVELAVEQQVSISPLELLTLHRGLDDAIATAVTSNAAVNDRVLAGERKKLVGKLGHDMRNQLGVALLSFDLISKGHATVTGSTGLMHGRTLRNLRDMLERSLTELRGDSRAPREHPIEVAELVREIEVGATRRAKARGLKLAITSVDRTVIIDGDRQMVVDAIERLLDNALEFTRKRTRVALSVRATADRVLFQVADHCGGLASAQPEDLFCAGGGLASSLETARGHGGDISVESFPGRGCLFTLSLPRSQPQLEACQGAEARDGAVGEPRIGSRVRSR